MASRAELVERALRYPYAAPSQSYLQAGERTLELEAIEVDLSRRAPLLAYGSNASPEVLRRKLGPDGDPVPAIRAELHGFDAVYSAHVSPYGAVPATLWRCRGAVLPVFVLLLTEAQLSAIEATEPNYQSRPLEGAGCRLEDGRELDGIAAYLSRHGPLLRSGSPLAVAEIAARGRSLPAIGQRQAVDAMRRAVRPDLDLEDFIAAAASDPELPPRWTAALRSDGREAPQSEAGEQAVGERQGGEVGEWPADPRP